MAVVASTPAIAALFLPLRRWVQGVIDRRFFRRTDDEQWVLESFGRRAQSEANPDSISADRLTTVSAQWSLTSSRSGYDSEASPVTVSGRPAR